VTFHIGDMEIELMRALDDDSPIGRSSPGAARSLHHIAYRV